MKTHTNWVRRWAPEPAFGLGTRRDAADRTIAVGERPSSCVIAIDDDALEPLESQAIRTGVDALARRWNANPIPMSDHVEGEPILEIETITIDMGDDGGPVATTQCTPDMIRSRRDARGRAPRAKIEMIARIEYDAGTDCLRFVVKQRIPWIAVWSERHIDPWPEDVAIVLDRESEVPMDVESLSEALVDGCLSPGDTHPDSVQRALDRIWPSARKTALVAIEGNTRARRETVLGHLSRIAHEIDPSEQCVAWIEKGDVRFMIGPKNS